jgi:hypothetical protein
MAAAGTAARRLRDAGAPWLASSAVDWRYACARHMEVTSRRRNRMKPGAKAPSPLAPLPEGEGNCVRCSPLSLRERGRGEGKSGRAAEVRDVGAPSVSQKPMHESRGCMRCGDPWARLGRSMAPRRARSLADTRMRDTWSAAILAAVRRRLGGAKHPAQLAMLESRHRWPSSRPRAAMMAAHRRRDGGAPSVSQPMHESRGCVRCGAPSVSQPMRESRVLHAMWRSIGVAADESRVLHAMWRSLGATAALHGSRVA